MEKAEELFRALRKEERYLKDHGTVSDYSKVCEIFDEVVNYLQKQTMSVELTPKQKESAYRAQQMEYVMQDMKAFLEEDGTILSDKDIQNAAWRYVYEGDYDCNLSYWQNIENLVREYQNQS